MEEAILYILLAGIICGIFTSMLAGRKGYSAGGWFFLGFFFSLIALLVAIGLPNKKAGEDNVSNIQSNTGEEIIEPININFTKKCPDCAETIKIEAKVCRYCGRKFSDQEIIEEYKRRLKQIEKDKAPYKQIVVTLAKMKDPWAVNEVEKNKKTYRQTIEAYAKMNDTWAVEKIEKIKKQEEEELKKQKEEEKLKKRKEEEIKKQKKELRRQAALAARPAILKRLLIVTVILIIAAGVVLYLANKTFLSVSSNPERARIYIDNRYTGKETPQTIHTILPGKHTLRLTKEGYEDFSGPFTVKIGNEKVVNTNLELSVGSLSVSSTPAGAKVYIDDNYESNTPLSLSLAEGAHNIKVVKEGYNRYEVAVTIQSGKHEDISVSFVKNKSTAGNLIWKYETESIVSSSPVIDNGKVYVGSYDHYIYCFNAENGSLIWKYKTGNIVSSSPVIDNGKVYIGSGDYYIYCFNAENGSLIWKYKTGYGISSSPAIDNGKVYVGSQNHYIYCLNAESGTLIWKYKTGNIVSSSPVINNNKVYIGSQDYYIYCLNAESGSLIWKYKTGNIVSSSPTIDNNKVYIGSQDYYIYCLNAGNGSLIWKYETGNHVSSSLAINNGKVYVGSQNHYIYCLSIGTP